MKKEIKVYSLHPWISNVQQFISHYRFEPLLDNFDFVWDSKEMDFLFVSEEIYTDKNILEEFLRLWHPEKNESRIFIQYLEETIKPDLNLFDYGVCYDKQFDICGRVIQILPANIWFSGFCPETFKRASSLEHARDILASKHKFCNFMYSHPSHPRDKIFRTLVKYKQIDALGSRFHNVDFVSTGFQGYRQETSTLHEPYKFTIAGENGEYLGYTSEKIWTAFWGHSIPIYWGNPDIENEINGKAFVHVRKYESETSLIEAVRHIDEDDELWCRMLCEPFQTSVQIQRKNERVQKYYAFFEKMFSLPIWKIKRVEDAEFTNKYWNWFEKTTPLTTPPLLKRISRKLQMIFDR